MYQGEQFIEYFKKSLLAQKLLEYGCKWDARVEIEEKDFGADENGCPMIAYFDVAFIDIKMPTSTHEGFHDEDEFGSEKALLYHSRFSDNWYLEVNGCRFDSSITDMNDHIIVRNMCEQLNKHTV